MQSLRNFPDQFLPEIVRGPEILRSAADAAVDQVESLAKLGTAAGSTRRLLFTGMGASYNACYPVINSLAAKGIPAQLVGAAELVHFRRSLLDSSALLVVVSQSGESAEVVRLLVETGAQRSRPAVASVTNGLENPVASRADIALDTTVGEEIGPSTMTFGASLIFLAAVARVIAGAAAGMAAHETRRSAIGAAAAAERLLAEPDDRAGELVRWHADRGVTLVLGRGPARAAAETGALLLKESAGMPAESLEVGQFRHGPLELASPNLAAILIATEPETLRLDLRLAADLVRGGAAVLVVAQEECRLHGAQSIVTGSADRSLLPAVSVIPVQLLAWRLARHRGRTPGILTQATKVTSRE